MIATVMTIDSRELCGRLTLLYEGGRDRETVPEASALELPTGPPTSGDVELARMFQLVGCAYRELNELSTAEARLLLAQRLLGTPERRSQSAYLRGLEELGYLY